MPATVASEDRTLTVADLHRQFGPMPWWRIRSEPAPGAATEEDVLRIHCNEDRLCELVDGILVEKDVGLYESLLAVRMASLLSEFVRAHRLGEVFGADGFMKLQPGKIRIPDVSFVSTDRLGKVQIKARRQSLPRLTPNLAVEVISSGNTRREMEQKLRDYFEAGVQLVWLIYPYEESVKVFTSARRSRTIKHPRALDGGKVLPGLQISLAELFAPLSDGTAADQLRTNGGK